MLAVALGMPAASTPPRAVVRPAAAPRAVMIELAQPPTISTYLHTLRALGRDSAVDAAKKRLGEIDTAQRLLSTRLASSDLEARLLFRLQRTYNGIAVRVDPDRVAALRRLPGVVSVRALVPKVRTNASSVPFLATPTVWESAADATGSGIRIGIIDSGIDYLHTHFGGSGAAADYAANDTTSLADGFFPTAKVVAGWDFVGDDYDASASEASAAVPQPDPDPMDCDGHGTHVAGTAAGFGVASNGSTYAGPYDSAIPFADLRIGPGMAPDAELYALRVFGCSGTTAVTAQAIEWAVDPDGDGDFSDRLDVINLSLTSPYADASDPAAVAADNAAALGVVVVAAAGNDGDQHYIAGSPAIASRALAVAASWDAEPDFPAVAVRVEAPLELAGNHQAGGALFGPAVPGAGVGGEAVLAQPVDACTPFANPASEIDGKVVLIERSSSCSAVTQVRHAQQAGRTGAIAVVVINDEPGLAALFDDGSGGDISIPALLIRQQAGAAIVAELPGVELTLTQTLLADVYGAFSSRGPRRAAPQASGEGASGKIVAKPDIAAPGLVITSSGMGSSGSGGSGAKILSGTSMASPHVAGLMALLRQLHPGWSVERLKALAMNTAHDVYLDPEATPPIVGPSHMGAGRIQPASAAGAAVVAYDAAAAELVSLSFGQLAVVAPATFERTVRLDNTSADAATYGVEILATSTIPGADLSLPDGATVLVPARASAELRLRLAVEPSLLQHAHDPTLDEATFGFARHWLSEVAGYVLLTPLVGMESEPLRLPFHAALRPAAAMQAVANPLDLGPGLSGATTLALAGIGVETGPSPPRDELSLASTFELQAVDAVDAGLARPAADLAFVGVASDLAACAGDLACARLFFAVASHGSWSTPNELRFEIWIDTNLDGLSDFLLFNTDEGSFNFATVTTDAFVSVLVDLETDLATVQGPLNGISPQLFHTVPFNNDVLVLPVGAAALGLAPGASEIGYFVRVVDLAGETSTATGDRELARSALGKPYRLVAGLPSDESVLSRFDLAAPGLAFAPSAIGPPIHPDVDGEELSVTFDLPRFAATGSLGILLLHHHNDQARAEVVTLASPDLPDLAMTATAAASVALDEVVVVTATVTNEGPAMATEVGVEMALPAGVDFVPEASAPGCELLGAVVRCLLGTITGGQEGEVEVAARAVDHALAGTMLSFELDTAAAEIDPDPLDNRTVVVLSVAADLFADAFESGDTGAWSATFPGS